MVILLLLLKNKWVISIILLLTLILSIFGMYKIFVYNIKHEAINDYKHTEVIQQQHLLTDMINKNSITMDDYKVSIDKQNTTDNKEALIITPILKKEEWSKVIIPMTIQNELNKDIK